MRRFHSYDLLVFCYNKNAGWAQPCTVSNVHISQSKTGQIISGKPEFEVTISNNCICTQTNVKVQCTGFSSVEQVDPADFSKIDDQYCLVNKPITQSSPVSFKYASDAMYNLTPVDSNVSCSWDEKWSLSSFQWGMIQIKELQTYNIRMQYELSEDSHFCAISCFLKILRTFNFRVSLKENENFFSFFLKNSCISQARTTLLRK